jgi:hypothetical protein
MASCTWCNVKPWSVTASLVSYGSAPSPVSTFLSRRTPVASASQARLSSPYGYSDVADIKKCRVIDEIETFIQFRLGEQTASSQAPSCLLQVNSPEFVW